MADVFISYRNTPDRRIIVRRLATILRAYEITVWWDYGLEAGESYRAQITAELANARVVAPLWCAESILSPWVRMEAELGKDKLVPARLQKVVPPDAFEAIQAADLIGWDGAVGNPRLLEFVRLICKRLGRSPNAPTDMIEDLGQLPAVVPLPEVAIVAASSSTATTGTTHDNAFWKGEWETHRGGSDLNALKAIAEHAPPYFATQARARIAEMEAEQELMVREKAEATAALLVQPKPTLAGSVKRIGPKHMVMDLKDIQYDDWEVALRSDTREAYEEFLKEWPEGGYADDAKIRLETIGQQDRLKVNAAILAPRESETVQACASEPGTGKLHWFKDIDIGPEMVVVPADGAISAPFAIGRFALTFAEWDAAQAHHDWQKVSGIAPRKPEDRGWGRGKQPAINVSWDDAKAYCKWLSAVTAKIYRLPSEAEWEHACRAGTTTEYSFGDDAKMLGQYAWFNANSGGKAHPVGEKKSNQWGLFDVHGNVWEWCEDAYSSSSRVLRGGSWGNLPGNLRSAGRLNVRPDGRDYLIGFRLARTL